MSLMKVGYRMMRHKAAYFDRKAVIDKMDRATHRVFSKFGAFVRTKDIELQLRHRPPKKFGVKSNVSNRPGISPVGTAPMPHKGTIVKNVEFWWDAIAQSVIIGHPLLVQPATGTREAVHALEYSGPSLMKSINKATYGQIIPIFVRARPSINPAFDEVKEKNLPGMYKDAMDKV